MHSITAIMIGHKLYLTSTSNLGFYNRQLTVLISKPKSVQKPKNSVLHQP